MEDGELDDPLVKGLLMFQAQINIHPSQKKLVIPWEALNNYLSMNDAPVLGINGPDSYKAFTDRYDAEEPTGVLHNVIDSQDDDSISDTGIRLKPAGSAAVSASPTEVPAIDPNHAQVAQMAQSELNRS